MVVEKKNFPSPKEDSVTDLMALTLSTQGKGEIKPIPGGFAGAIDVSDMPKEIRDILGQILGGQMPDEDDEDDE